MLFTKSNSLPVHHKVSQQSTVVVIQVKYRADVTATLDHTLTSRTAVVINSNTKHIQVPVLVNLLHDNALINATSATIAHPVAMLM
eukprot:7401-Heterococcus_DN1.PRE.2